MHVLIVDDAAPLRTRLREMIQDAAEVEVHESTHVDVLGPLDVIVLDVHLTAQSGLEALAQARRRFPSATIVVSTNDTSEHHRRACTAHGADFFFDKSREFDRIVDVVVARAR